MLRRRRTGEDGAFRSSLSMATRLAAAVITVAIVSLLAAMIVGLRTGASLAEDIYQDRILALRASANIDVTSQINFYERAALGLAESPQASVAIERFSVGIDELDAEGPPPTADIDALYEAYRTEFLEPQRAAGNPIDFRDIVSQRAAALRLQYEYAIDTGYADDPEDIDDAGDGSYWSETHTLVHPMYREVANRLDLVDVMLVSRARDVVYSARKGPELATSLEVGPFSGGVLSDVSSRVMDDPSQGTLMSDLSFASTYLQPVGVIAAPVTVDDGGVIGALVFVYDSAPFNAVLTADGEWSQAGYPDSSDTYMIGEDGTTRSEPRGYLEAPNEFLDELEELGEITPEQRVVIDGRGTTVLTLRAPDHVLRAVEDGDESIIEHSGFTDDNSLSSVIPVADESIDWDIVAGMSSDEARADLRDFRQVFAVGIAIFVALLSFVAIWWGNRIVRPVRAISERLAVRRAAREHYGHRIDDPPPVLLPERSPIEFHQLANSFETMELKLREQQSAVESAREERLRLLREMLPPGIVQRLSDGQVRALDEVPSVTVGVGTVEGLGALIHVDVSAAGRALVERLHGELDGLAAHHGVERIKIVGDAYFAACGHDRPYLDHAPRMVAFASDARDAIRAVARDAGEDLDLSFGVHTGPVTVGMTGGHRLVYDVWGPTVTIAHNLARVADVGEILISNDARRLLPQDLAMSEFATAVATGDDDRQMELSPSGVWILDDGATTSGAPA